MPITVAQKLCHDIVEPVLKPSSTNSKKIISSEKSINIYSNIKKNVKPKETLKTEKKKFDTKNESSHVTGHTYSRVKINEKRIKTTLVNSAVNTLISGPLRCDNNCLTLIHKRDQYISCKCRNKKTNLKGSSKEIQTLNKKNYSISDKACTHCIETVSCGTQFIDILNGKLTQVCNQSKSKIAIKFQDSNEEYRLRQKIMNKENLIQLEKHVTLNPPSYRYVGAKHWALSNYQTRGPDF